MSRSRELGNFGAIKMTNHAGTSVEGSHWEIVCVSSAILSSIHSTLHTYIHLEDIRQQSQKISSGPVFNDNMRHCNVMTAF